MKCGKTNQKRQPLQNGKKLLLQAYALQEMQRYNDSNIWCYINKIVM